MRMRVWSLALLSGVRTYRCCKLERRWQVCCHGCGICWQLQLQFLTLAWEFTFKKEYKNKTTDRKSKRKKRKERKKKKGHCKTIRMSTIKRSLDSHIQGQNWGQIRQGQNVETDFIRKLIKYSEWTRAIISFHSRMKNTWTSWEKKCGDTAGVWGGVEGRAKVCLWR